LEAETESFFEHRVRIVITKAVGHPTGGLKLREAPANPWIAWRNSEAGDGLGPPDPTEIGDQPG